MCPCCSMTLATGGEVKVWAKAWAPSCWTQAFCFSDVLLQMLCIMPEVFRRWDSDVFRVFSGAQYRVSQGFICEWRPGGSKPTPPAFSCAGDCKARFHYTVFNTHICFSIHWPVGLKPAGFSSNLVKADSHDHFSLYDLKFGSDNLFVM